MNKPAHPVAAPPIITPAYDEDGYGWAMAQAGFIRADRLDCIDWEHVAEEIESVGKSERRALRSNLTQILLHLIKWDAQPERRGASWYLSIMNLRDDAEADLADSPSLKSQLDELFAEAMDQARRKAVRETGLEASVINAVELTLDDAFNRSVIWPEAE